MHCCWLTQSASHARSAIHDSSQLVPDGAAPPLLSVSMAAGTTGALAWLACTPFDAIKTVQQSRLLAETPLTARAAYAALRSAGGSLYSGAVAGTGRAVLVTSLRLVVYESVKRTLPSD